MYPWEIRRSSTLNILRCFRSQLRHQGAPSSRTHHWKKKKSHKQTALSRGRHPSSAGGLLAQAASPMDPALIAAFPSHPNPRTRAKPTVWLGRLLQNQLSSGVLCKPGGGDGLQGKPPLPAALHIPIKKKCSHGGQCMHENKTSLCDHMRNPGNVMQYLKQSILQIIFYLA